MEDSPSVCRYSAGSARISRPSFGKRFAWRILLATSLFCFFTATMAQGSTSAPTLSLTPTGVSGPTGTAAPSASSTDTGTAINDCSLQSRDYNKGLRVGALFVILATSSIAVFGPVFLEKFSKLELNSLPFTIIKQFGTGVIISTAFVHLFNEADNVWNNPCLGQLSYSSTSAAIVMAGIALAFVVEYIGDRMMQSRANKIATSQNGDNKGTQSGTDNISQQRPGQHHHYHTHSPNQPHGLHTKDKLSVIIMEAGIIFHSVLIGITLSITESSIFATFWAVIVFHQAFEGLALGSRIADIPTKTASLATKMVMCLCFALITPIGMAIGLGVLNTYNENNRNTLIALGTLDSVSAGILIWVGLVEMLAGDWVFEGGEFKTAGLAKTLVGATSLVGGVVLMSLLGKWT